MRNSIKIWAVDIVAFVAALAAAVGIIFLFAMVS